ncbi:NAD(P)/FAD-dependent oxidoreductase [Caulobacter sp. UNC358MFTsu5.1]|uniref:NAD(P)/FAD-dependent oxidoreductase n=1 Tax=Caulobacter sp. UNC358MFTsu5.1 TaxID=1449049 RepID=UPI0004A7045A|nr:NAD(P)/FAD-dependent oxidoreductase [Caulobacter sp. UNC358MFTsu5.1]
MNPERLDAIVVGAGPAGLTAALYLGRFRRRVLVVDGGDSRAAWIPITHNHPGFPDGVAGTALLALQRDHALRYGAVIQQGAVEGLTVVDDGFELALDGRPLRAPTVLLACGVEDNAPDLPQVDESVRRTLLRICPICDGFEVTGQRVGVIGHGALGAREALFLRTYADRLTLIHIAAPEALPAEERALLARAGVAVIEAPIEDVELQPDRPRALCFSGAGRVEFDALYSALGVTPRTGLALAAGARHDDQGRLVVDDHQQTSIPGLYAAGDMVRGLNQITTAQGEAAIAATAMHNRLKGG